MALLVVTVMVVRKGYTKWVWIPLIPLAFDTAVTFVASWQKIFSTDPLVGYFQQHRDALAKLDTLTDPAAIDVQRAIVRNTMIQGTLSVVFLVMVAFVMLCALVRVIRTIRSGDTTTSEDPYQESNFYAPGDHDRRQAPEEARRGVREGRRSRSHSGSFARPCRQHRQRRQHSQCGQLRAAH